MVGHFEPLLSSELEPGSASTGPGPAWARERPDAGEEHLIDALRRGDEAAFARLVDLHHASMVRVAHLYVGTGAAAEEVAQEAWLGVLQGLARFEGRCTLKAWIFAIVANCAKSRGVRDRRTVPLSSLAQEDDGGPSVDPTGSWTTGTRAGRGTGRSRPRPGTRTRSSPARRSRRSPPRWSSCPPCSGRS